MLSERDMALSDAMIRPKALVDLVDLVDNETINSTTAKELFAILFEKGGDPAEIVREKGMVQVSDSDEIEKLVEQAMSDNPKSVADYKSGKKAAAKFLVGQVMRLSRGKADPQVVAKVLQGKLDVEGGAS